MQGNVKTSLWLPALVALFTLYVTFNSARAQEAKLHEFVTETGRFYDNKLVTDGTYLYGVRYDGHINGAGAVFRTSMDGGHHEVIHTFEDPLYGTHPVGTLVLSGTTLYGMTIFGGENNMGVIFRMENDGSEFGKLLDFNYSNGALPYTSLTISGTVLYGVSQQGGYYGKGLVFRINTDGTGYKKLLDFNGANGQSPAGSLAISGDTLFGVTVRGGSSDYGVIYRINADGTRHETLFNFDETSGYNPFGGLTVSSTTLYGTAGQGGSGQGFGSVYKINTDGTSFEEFVSFSAINPNGTLILIDSTLYGMSANGGNGSGVVFAIQTENDTYTPLHYFDNTSGRNPSGSLLYADDKLYGYVPGGNYDYGVIFSMDVDGTNYAKVKDFEATNDGYDPEGSLIFTATKAYGITTNGGVFNKGVIYSVNHDGTNYETVLDFDGRHGGHPETSLLMSDSILYGVTLFGGSENNGVLFRVDTIGHNYEVLHDFTYGQGSFPAGSLVDSGEGVLYGATSSGGVDNQGTIFRFNKETEEFHTLFNFSGSGALRPTGTMVLSDSILNGLSLGGVGDAVLFSIRTDGTEFTKIVDEDSDLSGRYGNSLALSDSVIYVSMTQGGAHDMGVLFSVKTDGSDFKKLFDFSFATGAIPEGAILVADTVIYGMTRMGGPDNSGVSYRINLDGTGYTPLFTFDDATTSSGRVTSSGEPSTTSGSLALFGDVMYATVTSQAGEITTGSIRQYNLVEKNGKEDEEEEEEEDETEDEDDEIVTSVGPELPNSSISLFPNPAVLYVTIDVSEVDQVSLIDSAGKARAVRMAGARSVDVSTLPPGMYYLVVNRKFYRFIKV